MNLDTLFSPNSIAVIGASTNPKKIGNQIVGNLIKGGYKENIFAVNPKGSEVLGLPGFPSILDIDKKIDLAIVAIPSEFVEEIIDNCVIKKVGSIIIISSGFSETGTQGAMREDRISIKCRDAGIVLLGPNCLGLLNSSQKLNASFAASLPAFGNVSLVSQSGAIISSIIDWSRTESLGFNKIISLGNKSLIAEAEILEYLYHDKSTEVIMMYLEELKASSKLTDLLIKYSKKKPTIVLFGGKTKIGKAAARSHTGSIVSSYKAVETYLTQAGVVLVSGLEQFFMSASVLSKFREIKGNQITIITNAGGPAIITCDALEDLGFSLAKPGQKSLKTLSEGLPDKNIKNPIDLLGDATAEDYKLALGAIENDNGSDATLVIITRQTSTDLSEIIKSLTTVKIKKPVLVVLIGNEKFIKEKQHLIEHDIPVFNFPEEAVSGLLVLYSYNHDNVYLEQKQVHRQTILTYENKRELSDDLPLLPYYQANDISEAKSIANRIGYPVVVKILNETIHKTEVGGVIPNIINDAALEEAVKKIGQNVRIGRMLKGVEVFVGAKKDQDVGCVVTFGTGGTYAEIYNDFSYSISPSNHKTIKSMINKTKIGEVLSGARGQKAYDIDDLINIILNTTRLMNKFENLVEIDLNPIIVTRRNTFIVDARFITKDENGK